MARLASAVTQPQRYCAQWALRWCKAHHAQAHLEGLKSQLGTGYTNRIHREDVAGALAHLIDLHIKGLGFPQHCLSMTMSQ